MEIHRCTLDDVDELLTAGASVFDDAPTEGWTRTFLADENNVLLVARSDGAPVGMLSATRLWHPDSAPELLVRELGVDETARRRGVASALVAAARELAPTLGCNEVWLVTEAGNLAANATYGAVGGDEEPAVVWSWRVG